MIELIMSAGLLFSVLLAFYKIRRILKKREKEILSFNLHPDSRLFWSIDALEKVELLSREDENAVKRS